MTTVREAYDEIRRQSKKWHVHLRPPCDPGIIKQFVAEASKHLRMTVPAGYLELLALTDGFQAQNGLILNAQEFMEANFLQWCATLKTVPKRDGVTVKVRPKPVGKRVAPTYAIIGEDGNVARFVGDFKSKEYRITNFFDAAHVLFASRSLGDLMLEISKFE